MPAYTTISLPNAEHVFLSGPLDVGGDQFIILHADDVSIHMTWEQALGLRNRITDAAKEHDVAAYVEFLGGDPNEGVSP